MGEVLAGVSSGGAGSEPGSQSGTHPRQRWCLGSACLGQDLAHRLLAEVSAARLPLIVLLAQDGPDKHTCGLNQVNPFDDLTELQRHAAELRTDPAAWMPWNYQERLPRAASG